MMDPTFNLTCLTRLSPTIHSQEDLASLSLDQLDALLQPQQILQLIQPDWLTSSTTPKVIPSLSKKKIKPTPVKSSRGKRVAPFEVFQHRVSPPSFHEVDLGQSSKRVKHVPFIPLDGPLKSFPSQLTGPLPSDLRPMLNFDGTPMTLKSPVFLHHLPSPPLPLDLRNEILKIATLELEELSKKTFSSRIRLSSKLLIVYNEWMASTTCLDQVYCKGVSPQQVIFIKQELLLTKRPNQVKKIIFEALNQRDLDALEAWLIHISLKNRISLLKLVDEEKSTFNGKTYFTYHSILTQLLVSLSYRPLDPLKVEESRNRFKALITFIFDQIKDLDFPQELFYGKKIDFFHVISNNQMQTSDQIKAISLLFTYLENQDPLTQAKFFTKVSRFIDESTVFDLVRNEAYKILETLHSLYPDFFSTLIKKLSTSSKDILLTQNNELPIEVRGPETDKCIALLIDQGYGVTDSGVFEILCKQQNFLGGEPSALNSIHALLRRRDLIPLFLQSLSALSYILFNFEVMTSEMVEACVVNLIQKNDTDGGKQAILQKAIELSFYFTNHFHPKEKSDRTAAFSLTLINILMKKGVTPHLLPTESKQNLLQGICLQNFPSSNTRLKPELINTLLPHYTEGDFSDKLSYLVYSDILNSNGTKEEREQRLMERLKLSPDKKLKYHLLKELIKYDYRGVIAAFSTPSDSFLNHFLTQLYLASTFNLELVKSKFMRIAPLVPSSAPMTHDLITLLMEISCHNPQELPIVELMKFFRSSLQVHAFDLNSKESPPDRATYKDENILELLLRQFSIKGTNSHYKITLALLDFIIEKIYSHLLDSNQLMVAGGNLQVFTPKVVVELERIIQALKDEHSLLNRSSTSLVDSSSVRSVSTPSEKVDLNQKALGVLSCLLSLVNRSQYIKKEEGELTMTLQETLSLHFIKVLDSSPVAHSIPTKCWTMPSRFSLLSVMKDLNHLQLSLVAQHGFQKMQTKITKINKIIGCLCMPYVLRREGFSSNLMNRISQVTQSLKQGLEGQTKFEIILPGGYNTSTGGHFVLYYIQKQPDKTYSFMIINGGEGCAPSIILPSSGKRKVYDYYYAGLTLKELSPEFFHTLFNFWIASASKDVNQMKVLNFIDQSFKKTQPSIQRRLTTNHPHAPQKMGSCAIKSITPLLKRTLGDQAYWRYKYEATRHSNASFGKKISEAPMQDLIDLFNRSAPETLALIEQIKNDSLAKERQRFRKIQI